MAAHILQLPNEILYLFAEAVAAIDAESRLYENDDGGWVRRRLTTEYGGLLALVLSCKRFQSVLTPILYENTNLYRFSDITTRTHGIFLASMRQNPSLITMVKHLTISIQFGSNEMRSLYTLPNLISLTLVDVKDESKDEETGLSPEEEGSAQFVELRFMRLRVRPEIVKRFLKWPSRLRVFIMDHMSHEAYGWQDAEKDPAYRCNSQKVSAALGSQRQNLEVLKLSFLGYDLDQCSFDMSCFPNLHTLQESVAYETPVEEACQNWLTPNIHTVILDFDFNDEVCVWSDFNEDQVNTATRFAELARKYKLDQPPGGVGLKTIGIVVFNNGEEAWEGNEECGCQHGRPAEKTKIATCLRNIESFGFSAFWVGYSGTRHTLNMIEKACSCEKPVGIVEKISTSVSGS